MNPVTTNCIDELIFMKSKGLFSRSDVILYHPGHFPELNEQLFNYYRNNDKSIIMIPDVFNTFLGMSEYEYYTPLLTEKGIKKEKLCKIPVYEGEQGVEAVIRSAFQLLNGTNYKYIMLAGKSFFSRRFYLLASIYAAEDKVIDVLPLNDNRGIVPANWHDSKKGRERILNELEQYGAILKKFL